MTMDVQGVGMGSKNVTCTWWVPLVMACAACEHPEQLDEASRGRTDSGGDAAAPAGDAAGPSALDTESPALDLSTDEPSAGELGGMGDPGPLSELWQGSVHAPGVELPEKALTSSISAPDGSDDRTIVGTDDRKPVADTRVHPFSTIVALFPKFPGESEPRLCTGSVIGPSAVLTAAHCVYDADAGGYAESTRVVPATYPRADTTPALPFGTTYGIRAFVPSAYRSATEITARRAADYAVLRLRHRIGDKTGIRKVGAMPDLAVGRPVLLTGYHDDKWVAADPQASWPAAGVVMQTSRDRVRNVYDGLINHYADSHPGASGSPLVSDGAFADTVFAVHIAGPHDRGNPYNIGVVIDEAKLTQIRTWSQP
jgi:V8-like Glu-specific endopeptidase